FRRSGWGTRVTSRNGPIIAGMKFNLCSPGGGNREETRRHRGTEEEREREREREQRDRQTLLSAREITQRCFQCGMSQIHEMYPHYLESVLPLISSSTQTWARANSALRRRR